MSIPVWLLGPMFLLGGISVSSSSPVFLPGGLCLGGRSLSGRPPVWWRAGGTHPTGMLSCLRLYVLIWHWFLNWFSLEEILSSGKSKGTWNRLDTEEHQKILVVCNMSCVFWLRKREEESILWQNHNYGIRPFSYGMPILPGKIRGTPLFINSKKKLLMDIEE